MERRVKLYGYVRAMRDLVGRIVRQLASAAGYSIIRIDTPTTPVFNLRPDRHSVLVAGPFVGEFGWELMGWQGYIRRLSRAYTRTVVISRPSSEYLYRDFATEFIEFDPGPIPTEYYNGFGAPPFIDDPSFVGADRIRPGSLDLMHRFARENVQEFVRLGREQQDAPIFDVVIHARLVPSVGDGTGKHLRNWPIDRWDVLTEQLAGLRIAAIGRREMAYCPSGVVDLRDAPLEQQCAVLHRAGCCVGPSSGAMHLAALCGVPLVVWTDDTMNNEGGNRHRYVFGWNPFSVPVTVLLRDGWMPSVSDVLASIRERLANDVQNRVMVID